MWYTTRDGKRFGPYTDEQLRRMVDENRIAANDMLWQEGTPTWVPASSVPGLLLPPVIGSTPGRSKVTAAILAICFLGAFGVHKSYLDIPSGKTMLLVAICTAGVGIFVTWPIATVEGVIYLCSSDGDFERTYVQGKKAWF